MPDPRPILWAPTPERAAAIRMAAYMRWLEQERGLAFADYQALWAWSVADLEGFWTSIIDFFGLQVHDRDVVLGRRAMPGADWFPGARVNLAAQGRLNVVEGSVENVLPGVDLHLARDSHTFGSMWVTVRNDGKADSQDTWVLAGDLVYQFTNLKNDGSVVGVDTMYTPVGLAVGSQMNLLLATEEMMKQAGYDDTRVIPIHEEGLADRFPSRITKENLRISEICLADGTSSVVA